MSPKVRSDWHKHIIWLVHGTFAQSAAWTRAGSELPDDLGTEPATAMYDLESISGQAATPKKTGSGGQRLRQLTVKLDSLERFSPEYRFRYCEKGPSCQATTG